MDTRTLITPESAVKPRNFVYILHSPFWRRDFHHQDQHWRCAQRPPQEMNLSTSGTAAVADYRTQCHSPGPGRRPDGNNPRRRWEAAAIVQWTGAHLDHVTDRIGGLFGKIIGRGAGRRKCNRNDCHPGCLIYSAITQPKKWSEHGEKLVKESFTALTVKRQFG